MILWLKKSSVSLNNNSRLQLDLIKRNYKHARYVTLYLHKAFGMGNAAHDRI